MAIKQASCQSHQDEEEDRLSINLSSPLLTCEFQGGP